MKAQKVILIFIGIALASGLFFLGKTTDSSKKKDKPAEMPAPSSTSVSFESYEESRLAALQPPYAQQVRSAGSDTARARIWLQYDSPALAAWYFYKFARAHEDGHHLEEAGDRLMAAAKSGSDTAVSNNCINFALQSYEGALKFSPGNPDLTLKVAEAYVDGSPEPMKGITLLRGLSDSLPDYMPAQIALGRFAIVSGQYEKAKERLEKVLKAEPGNSEAMYFLAFAEEGLGNNERAVALLEQCKLLVNNPGFDKEINVYIDKLKNK